MYVCGGVWPSLSYNQWEEVVILTAQCRPVARFLRGGGHFDVSVDLNTTIIHVV